jgi:glutamate 5-kinase
MSSAAGSRPILGLHSGNPLLLHEKQTTADLLGQGQLLALFNGFLNRKGVEVEQCLHGDRHLLELPMDDVEHLLDQLLVGDVITEDVELAGHGVEEQ